MTQELVGKLVLTSAVTLVFAVGRLLYLRYFKAPVKDYTANMDDLGEDSPVIEALLSMRERCIVQGDHRKALEYSTKALERCPESARIRDLVAQDQRRMPS